MKNYIFLILTFIIINVNAQTVLQEIINDSGTFFATSFDLSLDNSTLVISRNSIGEDVFFYKKIDGQYVLDSSLDSPVGTGLSPTVKLSADGKRCLLFNRQGVGSFQTYIIIYEYIGSEWVQVGQRIDSAQNGSTNANPNDVAISSDGNTVVFGEPKSNNNLGSAIVYEFNGDQWIQKGQIFNGSVGLYLGEAIDLSEDGNTLIIATSTFNNSTDPGIVTTWDYEDEQWNLRPSIIEEEFTSVQMSDNGNVFVGASRKGKYIKVYENVNNTWVRNSIELWPDHLPPNSWNVNSIYLTSDGTSFSASFINASTQETAMSIYSQIDVDVWIERKIGVTTELFDDYQGRTAIVNGTGDILLYNYSRYDNNQGKLIIVEDERRPINYLCAFADINCNDIKDDLEYFIPNSIFETNDAFIYFGGSSEYVSVSMEEGENKVEFISSIFEYPSEDVLVNTQYLYVDTICFPVKFIDENTVHVEALAFADTYVCNRTTEFSIDVTNLSPSAYEVKVDFVMTSIGDDVIDSLLSSRMLGAMDPLTQQELELEIDMPSEDFTGDILGIKVKVYMQDIVTGETVDSNIIDLSNELRCSFDPNDKAVFPIGVGEDYLTLFDQSLHYRVRFQNTGNFPAQDVVIKDQLDGDLDWNTMKIVKASHDLTSVTMVDGLVSFEFANIELPDSISNEPMSHGYIMYSIDHKSGLAENTEITNFAEIFFDQNAAIVTNETKNTLVTEIGVVGVKNEIDDVSPLLYPNPASNEVFIDSDIKFETVEIYNLQGKLLSSQKVMNNSFNVSEINHNGILLLTLRYADGIQVAKIAKN